jgi:hypothetical protein
VTDAGGLTVTVTVAVEVFPLAFLTVSKKVYTPCTRPVTGVLAEAGLEIV